MKRLKTLVSPRPRANGQAPTTISPRTPSRLKGKSSLASRPPLSIQVPTSPPEKEAVDVLKEQVATLKDRIADLDTEVENGCNTDIELHCLNEQLQAITLGISQVEQERQALREAKAMLAKEKREIQGQLYIREQEVQSLVRRCQSQEEKVRETAKLRAFNSKLSTQLEGLKSSLSMKDEEISQVENLQKELQECREARTELSVRLEKIKKDHDHVVDTLNSCFVNMQKLQEKQQEHDEDRKREMKRAELALEKQRLAHQEKVNELRAEIQSRQERLEQMETILRDNMATSTALRRERVELKAALKEALAVKEELVLKVAVMEKEHENFAQVAQIEFNARLEELRNALADKDLVVETLEQEVSNCMDKLMNLSEEMEALLHEKSELEHKSRAEVEKLEQEIWALKERVSTKEVDITVMSSSISVAAEEKAEFLSELNRLRERVKELEEENAFIMDMEQQLDDVNFSLLEVQEGNDIIRENFEEAVNDLRQQFEQQKQMWFEMEKGLTERVATMEVEKANLGETLVIEQETCTNLRAALDAIQSQYQLIEQETTCQHQKIEDLESQLEQERRISKEKDVHISRLRAENDKLLNSAAEDRESHTRTITALQKQIDDEHTISGEKFGELQRVSSELSRTRDESQQIQSKFKAQLQGHESTIAALTDKLNLERRSKIDIVKSLRDENDNAREGWRNEMDQLNDLLHQKICEVESLQLELVSISGKGEDEQIAADRTMKKQSERLDAVQRELDDQRRQLHQKSAEVERLTKELNTTQVQLRHEIASMIKRGAEQESEYMSLEADLRRERSACEGKDSALESMGRELEMVRQELTDKQRVVRTLQSEVESLRNALDHDLGKRDEALTVQVQQMALVTTELNAKRQLLEATTSQRDALQDELNAKEIDLSLLREQLTLKSTYVEDLYSQLADENRQTATYQTRVQELKMCLENAVCDFERKSEEFASLQREFNGLQTEASSREATLKSQIEKILALEKEVKHFAAIAEQKTASLEEFKIKLSVTRTSFESDLLEAQNKQTEQENLVSSLQAELQVASLDIRKKDTNILALTAEIESVRFKSEQESKGWAKQYAEQENALARKDAELASIKSLLEEGAAALQEELKIQTTKVCSLTKSLAQLEFELDERERKYRTSQNENDVQVSALRRDAQALRQSKEVASEQYRTTLQERDDLINTLNKRVEDLQQEVEVQATARNELISLRHKLQKAEIDLAISQDELRDLKMIDLKDAEETIESLESTIQALRTKARADETNNTSMVSDLRGQVQQLEAKLYISERGLHDTKHLHDKVVSKMQGELDVVKQENEALKLDLKEKFNKLNERHSTITSLTAQKDELELKESRLLTQIRGLESDCQKAKEEQEKTALALEREIEKQWSSRQDNDIEFLQRQSIMQKKLREYEDKVSSLQKGVSDAEAVLEARTKVLADMVAHNKDAEERYERASLELKTTREVSEQYRTGMEASQQEVANLRLGFSKIEDELLFAIQSERELREAAEVELENLHATLRTKRDDKELTELEKENNALRDKVRRQEAFLLRKIQKDKALRDRNGKPSGIATPARSNSLRKPLSSARKDRLTVASSENIYDDELDELLS